VVDRTAPSGSPAGGLMGVERALFMCTMYVCHSKYDRRTKSRYSVL
jgi:hypothetical protein